MTSKEIIDRRQRAREAFWDGRQTVEDGIEAVIETATRVQITPEMGEVYRVGLRQQLTEQRPSDDLVLRAALEAAGFEVEP
jgi:hypothetical protein